MRIRTYTCIRLKCRRGEHRTVAAPRLNGPWLLLWTLRSPLAPAPLAPAPLPLTPLILSSMSLILIYTAGEACTPSICTVHMCTPSICTVHMHTVKMHTVHMHGIARIHRYTSNTACVASKPDTRLKAIPSSRLHIHPQPSPICILSHRGQPRVQTQLARQRA